VVSIIVVLNYLGQDIKISAQVTCSHILHYHALYCSIESLHLPIATWLVWEASNMFDMEVVKQLLHLGIGELATIVTLEYLGGMLLEEWTKHLQDLLGFLWVIGSSQAYLEKQSMMLTTYLLLLLLPAQGLISIKSTSSQSSLDRAITGFCTFSRWMHWCVWCTMSFFRYSITEG